MFEIYSVTSETTFIKSSSYASAYSYRKYFCDNECKNLVIKVMVLFKFDKLDVNMLTLSFLYKFFSFGNIHEVFYFILKTSNK